MVKYACEACKTLYDTLEKAEECEKKPLIGPDIKPGLILESEDSKSFLVFYAMEVEGHEKQYIAETIAILGKKYVPFYPGQMTGSDLTKRLTGIKFKKASKDLVDGLNQFTKQHGNGLLCISGSLENYGIKELHSDCDFLD